MNLKIQTTLRHGKKGEMMNWQEGYHPSRKLDLHRPKPWKGTSFSQSTGPFGDSHGKTGFFLQTLQEGMTFFVGIFLHRTDAIGLVYLHQINVEAFRVRNRRP